MAPVVNFDFGGGQKELVVGNRKVTISMPVKSGRDVAITSSSAKSSKKAKSSKPSQVHPKGGFCSSGGSAGVIKKLLFWEIRLDTASERVLRSMFVEPEATRLQQSWGNVHIQNHLSVLALDISSKDPAIAARLNGRDGVELKQFREYFATLMENNGKDVEIEAIALHQHPSMAVIEVKLPKDFACAYPRPYITLCRAQTETYRLAKAVVESPPVPVAVSSIANVKITGTVEETF